MTDLTTIPLDDELGEILRAELLTWPKVTIRSMMGCIAFSHGKHMLGCYVNRTLSKKKPWWMNRSGEATLAWVRLTDRDAERALRRSKVQKCRTEARTWIEIPLESRKHLLEAIHWFSVAYEHPPRAAKRKRKGK